MRISVALLASLSLVSAWPTQITFSKDVAGPIRKLLGKSAEDVKEELPRLRKGLPLAHGPHHGPPHEIDMSDLTIGQILNGSLHSPPHDPRDGPPKYPPLRKFAYFVNISNESPFKDSIYDEKAHITLLAPDDFALTPPGHGGPHHGPPGHDHEHHGPPGHEHEHHGPPGHEHEHHGPPGHDHEHHGPPGDDSVKRSDEPEHRRRPHQHEDHSPRGAAHPMLSSHILSGLIESSSDDEDDKRAERKEKILKIITLILRYHLVDSGAYTALDLVNNATIASSLDDLRIRSEPHLFPYKHLTFNFFARTRGPTIKASNGYIHLLSTPLLPPLTPLEDLFIAPAVFSTLTSGLQKVELDEVLSPWVHHGHEDEVAPVVTDLLSELVKEHDHSSIRHFTVFAPTNGAFLKLGFKINAFLFSPFGRHVLKAVLSYHIVPDVAVFSDFISDKSKVSFNGFESVDSMPARDEASIAEMVEAGLRRPFKNYLPGEGEIKVRHLVLKTLFNDTSLPLDVYESRRFGKGPVRRDLWVGQETETPGSRVHVAAADAVAYKSAVHVIGSLIRPPFAHPPPHHHEGGPHHGGDHEHDEGRHIMRFARSLSPKKEGGCRHKRSDIWEQLLKH